MTIFRIKLNRQSIVGNCKIVLTESGIKSCPAGIGDIIVRLQLNRLDIICKSEVVFFGFFIGISAVDIDERMGRVNLNGFCKIFNG